MKLQTVISAKATFACFGNPYKQGSFVISGGFQFIDTYLPRRAGGTRGQGDTCSFPQILTEIEAKPDPSKYFRATAK